mgnify:CR=1 FL=1
MFASTFPGSRYLPVIIERTSFTGPASTTIANTISGAGNVSANITGATSDLTVNSSINLTGGKANLVTDGNLLVKQAISTTNATASAVFLESGKSTAAGTATGGDIQISGSGAVTVGSGGRATYMTGSIAGSTGMGVLAGNNRYNSDETTTNYTAALGSGAYAIYREKPLVSVQVNSVTKTYDGTVNATGTGTVAALAGVAGGGEHPGAERGHRHPVFRCTLRTGGVHRGPGLAAPHEFQSSRVESTRCRDRQSADGPATTRWYYLADA